MTTIYLVRHAEAEGNLYRIAHGHYNSCITDDRGCRQIRALAERFRDVPVDAVYASDLIRTRTTAQSIYLPKGLQLHPDPAFREICMGEWEEHCWYELLRKYPQSHDDFNHRLAGRSPAARRPGRCWIATSRPCGGWPGSMTARRWPFSPTAPPCGSCWEPCRA